MTTIGWATDWIQSNGPKKIQWTLEYRQRLEALPGWSWDVLAGQWEEGFARLKQFADREGHCRVPTRYTTDNGYRLGVWVSNQRDAQDTMDIDRRQRLEALPNWSWDAFSDRWEEGFSRLREYSNREGHCRVPRGYATDDGYRLYRWVRRQRDAQDTMDVDRRQRLEALPGWSWDPLSDQWEEGFTYLKEFSDREGHCRVPVPYKTGNGYRLGAWLSTQRLLKDAMDIDRRRRLEALPGWSWNLFSDQWEAGFAHLKTFSDREGHCRVLQGYKTDGGYHLNSWVANQRMAKETMDIDRRQRLEALPGWSWNVFSDRWEDGFLSLKQFVNQKGHCQVPLNYKTSKGYRLGIWVTGQRKAKDTMSPDRRQRLEALPGWSWNRFSDKWEEGFSHLKRFSDREGHCRVTRFYETEEGYPLGHWVSGQRTAKDTMIPDRRQRLEALPGWVWRIER